MNNDKTKEPKPRGYFAGLLDELKSRNLPIPAALLGEAKPLALSTRQDLPVWAELHGYDASATETLNRAISTHARSAAYQQALAADLAVRVDLDGSIAGPVSEMDRHSAALSLYVKERKDTAKRAAQTPPAPSTSPSVAGVTLTSSPAAGPPKRPIIRLGALSAEEVERRARVLEGIKPQ